VYDTEHVCFAALPNMKRRTVLLGGFSKDYAMTGWRIGYICADATLIEAFEKLHQYAIMSAPTPAQYGALEALRNGEEFVLEMREEYDRRRKLVVSALKAMNLDCVEPKGAFYAFPSIARTGLTSDEFTEWLLTEEQVAVVPGTAFGAGGENHVRIAYCKSYEQIETALERIERFLRKF
jgi:aminotransferase